MGYRSRHHDQYGCIGMAGVRRKPRKRGRALGKLLYGLSLAFLGFGLFSLGWAVWPAPTVGIQMTIPAGALPGSPSGESYASLGAYELSISWPKWLRVGDVGKIEVTLAAVEAATGEGVDREGQIVLVAPSIINLSLDPPGHTQANLAPDQDLSLTWEVEGQKRGTYPGEIVVSFGFYNEALEELVNVPVAVVDLAVQVMDLWGMGVGLALWFGVVGLVLWGALFVLGRMVMARRN